MARKLKPASGSVDQAAELVMQHNAGREPERLAIKYAIMRTNAFAFLRGSPHLYHQRINEVGLAPEGPAAWLSGDLHLENYGTYLGDNGLAYFDVNDFDSACLGPLPWDILRLATSLLVAAPALSIKRSELEDLSRLTCEAWLEALRGGKARWIERRTAEGAAGDLMQTLRRRDPVAFLDSRTKERKGVRSYRLDRKALPLAEEQKASLGRWLKSMASGRVEQRFFKLVDAARRIAGVDSLGAPRYSLLIEGTGSPDGNLLLDLKSAEPSAAAPYSPFRQPAWDSEAHRVVDVQKRCQAIPPAMFSSAMYDGRPFVLRSLQPTEDRLDLAAVSRDPHSFGGVLQTMAELAAWAALRASGIQTAARADELMAFGAERGISDQLLETAKRMERVVLADWKNYCDAYDNGAFKAQVETKAAGA